MRYTRIWSDRDGETHFEDVEVELAGTPYAPPAPPLDVSAPMAASRALFFSFPPGWFGDWHPSPRRQLYLNLGGHLEVEVSDGEVRHLGPGDVVLTEDLEGRGHVTRVLGEAPSVGVFVHLAEPGDVDAP